MPGPLSEPRRGRPNPPGCPTTLNVAGHVPYPYSNNLGENGELFLSARSTDQDSFKNINFLIT